MKMLGPREHAARVAKRIPTQLQHSFLMRFVRAVRSAVSLVKIEAQVEATEKAARTVA